MSPVSGDLAVSATGAAFSQQRRRQQALPQTDPEDSVELSAEAQSAGDTSDESESQ